MIVNVAFFDHFSPRTAYHASYRTYSKSYDAQSTNYKTNDLMNPPIVVGYHARGSKHLRNTEHKEHGTEDGDAYIDSRVKERIPSHNKPTTAQ